MTYSLTGKRSRRQMPSCLNWTTKPGTRTSAHAAASAWHSTQLRSCWTFGRMCVQRLTRLMPLDWDAFKKYGSSATSTFSGENSHLLSTLTNPIRGSQLFITQMSQESTPPPKLGATTGLTSRLRLRSSNSFSKWKHQNNEWNEVIVNKWSDIIKL